MDIMTHQPTEREAQLMQAHREELVERIARAMREDGTVQPLPGLHLNRRSSPRAPIYGVMEPSVAVIAQGSKNERCELGRQVIGVRVECFERRKEGTHVIRGLQHDPLTLSCTAS